MMAGAAARTRCSRTTPISSRLLRRSLPSSTRSIRKPWARSAARSRCPPSLTNALDDFAKQNPDLVDFDAARGIVKFKTDFTFATGSDPVTEKAKAAIGRFADDPQQRRRQGL